MKFKFNFLTALGIISIIGFGAIFIDALTEVDVSPWANSFLFIIIGFALFVSGGYRLFFEYFKKGLTYDEVNKIATIFLGLFSIIVGLVTLPIFNLDYDILRGSKLYISAIAIFIIAVDMIVRRNRC